MEGIRWAFRSEAWRPTKQEWLLALSLVQKEEKERVMRFVFKKDAKSSLIGRLLLRKAIAQMLAVPYHDLQLARTEKGKPFLVNKITDDGLKNFSFNVSHQGDFTVLAAEPCCQVGVDVMKTTYPGGTDVQGFFHLMRKQFTPREWRTVNSQPTEWTQLQMFYRHWCLKESYVKAIGVGIGHDLQAVEFNLPTRLLSTEEITCDSQLYLKGSISHDWSFQETKLDEEHQVAVALALRVLIDKVFAITYGFLCRVAWLLFTSSFYRKSAPSFQQLNFKEVISTGIPWQESDEKDWDVYLQKKETFKQ
ncbi:predicted protein [Nematostella vectensis]|uniref:L-aminoadipate-semialdehyde dehydrogenase-phosphopantetheinyl transferase n=1 Tax=Nematostella vectensis TaxID=45351 RepID=A7RNF6_NEMVE|nr:predicted protein [Nematostella vectensis]|eukprot:XP_001639115.1 predicted protein [Nematostella vectensis]